MTTLLQRALTQASNELNQQDQDRLANMILGNMHHLHDLLDELAEEAEFDNQASQVIESQPVQNLLSKVAEKHRVYSTR